MDEYTYEAIIKAGLDGWSAETLVINAASGNASTRLSARDVHCRTFLARCSLVNREWNTLAQRILYRSLLAQEAATLSDPRLKLLVRSLILRTSESTSSAQTLQSMRDFQQLRRLIVRDDVLVTILRPTHSLTAYPAPHLTHLLYQGGNTHLLGHLLAVLPQLQSLHVGRFNFSSSQSEPQADIQIACQLREVTFQSIYHYGPTHLSWLFGSSAASIDKLTVANFGSLLYDLVPILYNARHLSLTIKHNYFGVPEDPDQYQLVNLLQRFVRLEKLELHVGIDWSGPWPDTKHESLQVSFPHLNIIYKTGKCDFLDAKVVEDARQDGYTWSRAQIT